MTLDATVVDLGCYPAHPAVQDVKRRFVADVGTEDAKKSFTPNDWKRVAFAVSMVPEGSILDVGTGQGHLSNSLARVGVRHRHATIDIKTSTRFRKHGNYEQIRMSAASMTFSNGEFDTVVCMEVVEHLTDDDLYPALREIRRVAKRRLIVTVPFCEPLPLAKYHHQRFDSARILELFPQATYTLLLKSPITRVPWLLIES